MHKIGPPEVCIWNLQFLSPFLNLKFQFCCIAKQFRYFTSSGIPFVQYVHIANPYNAENRICPFLKYTTQLCSETGTYTANHISYLQAPGYFHIGKRLFQGHFEYIVGPILQSRLSCGWKSAQGIFSNSSFIFLCFRSPTKYILHARLAFSKIILLKWFLFYGSRTRSL